MQPATPLISVAPMMDWTDRHDRYFLRLISPHVRLYTEMVTAAAMKYGDADYLLQFHPLEHPLALQLGGSEPALLAECAQRGEEAGYDEINLNVGCPSDRVQKGAFGACLMLQADLVAACVFAMQNKVSIPVTVKCRIGVDDQDSFAFLQSFIEKVSAAGCRHFIIHARKAWLKGLSPKQNREVPPLDYGRVKAIKKLFPQLTIIMNGGIKTMADITAQLQVVDGVMIGREAYSNPYLLTEIESRYFNNKNVLKRSEVMMQFIPYVEAQLKRGVRLSAMTRHILGLYHGVGGARAWRRYLSEKAHLPLANSEIIKNAVALVGE